MKIKIKNKAIIIGNLTRFSLIICRLIKWISGRDVYYVSVSGTLIKNLDALIRYEAIGIRWVSKEYLAFSDYRRGSFIAWELADAIFEQIGMSRSVSIVNRCLSEDRLLGNKMAVFWKQMIYVDLDLLAKQYAAAEFLLRHGKYSKVLIVTFNGMAQLARKGLRARENVNLMILCSLSWIGFLYVAIAKSFLNLLRIFLFKTGNKSSGASGGGAHELSDSAKNIESYEVAFFPHQGIFYGGLFIKDSYYSEDHASPLHKSQILHISHREQNSQYMVESYRYYREHGIPHTDTEELMLFAGGAYRDLLKLINEWGFHIFLDWAKFGISFMFFMVMNFVKVRAYSHIMSKFKMLKLVLVGYDFLFPIELSLALSLSGVKVCAHQERFIQAFYPETSYIFDYYFVAGEIINKRGLKHSAIDHCIPIGLVRVDNLYEYESNPLPDGKYDVIKDKRLLVLALDYHLPADDFEDISRSVGKVEHTRQFYLNLIELAKEFPTVHITIKGKDTNSYRSAYIEDIVKEIEISDNIEIEFNLEKYNPYYLAEKADLTIACHTSLADELLAAGRKVILFEITDHLETLFNYDGLPVVVHDYAELKYHVSQVLKGSYLDDRAIQRLQKDFYSDCYHGNVCKSIRSILEQLIADNHSNASEK